MRDVPSTVSWVGGSGNWGDASHWLDQTTMTNHVPTAHDDAVIGLPGVTVRIGHASRRVRSLALTDPTSVLALSGSLTTVHGVTVDGTVALGAGSTFTVASDYTQTGGSTVLNGGTLAAGGLVDIQAGVLSGSGVINGDVRNADQLNVGGSGSAGLLTVNGNYTQTAAGVLNVKVGGPNAGTDFDQLAVTGNAALDGTLNASRINGFTPAGGASFQVVTFGSGSGAFAAVNLDPAFVSPPTYDQTDVTLTTFVWNTAAPLPLQRHEVQTAVVNGQMYIFGGFDAPSDTTTEVDRYDPVSNTWTRMADMPIPLTHAGVAVDGQTVYLAGGWYGTSPGVLTNRVLEYDAATDTWSDAPPLPQARGSGGLVLLGRQLHFFGGLDAPEFDGNDQRDHWVLNLDGGTGWTSAAPLPSPRFHMGYVGLNGEAYAIGGESQHGTVVLAEVDAYDPATDTWARLSDMPVPTAHIDDATFVLNGQIVTVGGSAADGSPLANVLAYDPSTDSWGALPSLPVPLSGTAAQQINGQIIVAGGSSSDSTDNTTTWITS